MTCELNGIRAMLCCPTYGPVEPVIQKALRVAMMSASNHGLWWAGDISPDHIDFGSGRNQAAQAAFDFPDSTDGIVWVDSDILLEPSHIWRLVGTAKEREIDFLAGVYHKKGEPYDPVIYWYEPDLDAYFPIERYEPGFVTPIGAAGFGMMWTSTKTIQAIANNKSHFEEVGRWFPDTRHMPKNWRSPDGRPPLGEDFNFCDKARMAGIQLYLDTGIMPTHCGNFLGYNRDMYLKWLKENGGHYIPPDKEGWRG
jgi:hypothetical protein